MSIAVQTCSACGRLHYPAALLCFECAGAAFHDTEIATATILAVTEIVHRIGARGADPVRLALVEIGPGTRLLARLAGDASPGSTVTLAFDGPRLTATPLRR